MGRYQALLQERADLAAEGRALFDAAEREGRGLTADESARDDAITARLDAVADELTRIERQRDRERAQGGFTPANVSLGLEQTVRREASGRLVDGAGRDIPLNVNGFPRLVPAAPDAAQGRFESGRDLAALKPWGSDTGFPFGEFLQAVYRARTGRGTDPRLMAAYPGQGMNETVPADGGFLVGTDMAVRIDDRVRGGEILSRVDRIPLSANANSLKLTVLDETSRATGSRYGGVQAYWVEEGGTKTASKPALAQIKLELHKLAALGYATDELLQDAPAMERLMTTAFANEIRFMTEDSLINGTGAGMPLGILNSSALVTVAKETGQDAATVVWENVIAMYAAMYPPSVTSAVWHVNAEVIPLLQTMNMAVGTGGVPVFLPANGATGAPFSSLFGRPIIPIEYSAAKGTVGDILFVDWSEYALIDKGGIQTASSIHVAFVTDETAFRAVYRVDGAPKWRTSLTPYKGALATSPFVALATRA